MYIENIVFVYCWSRRKIVGAQPTESMLNYNVSYRIVWAELNGMSTALLIICIDLNSRTLFIFSSRTDGSRLMIISLKAVSRL